MRPGQRAQVCIGGPGLAEPELPFQTDRLHIEAPNWTVDGTALLLNGNGLLWRLGLRPPEEALVPVEFEGLPA